MLEIISSDWTDEGNGQCSAIVTDTAQPTNYRAVVVRPVGRRSWGVDVNGKYRGSYMRKRVAKVEGIGLAKSDLALSAGQENP